MAKFKVTISDPRTGKASAVELEGAKAKPLLGRNIGDVLDGAPIGLQGRKLRITGGSDKDGVPLRPDVHGGGKKHLILSKGVGFRAKGCSRERRLVRGRTITDETYQVNLEIVELEAGDAATPGNRK
ncbi:30S ribosomal protein S6e [Candidatus Bathyarchaeota archaeon]|nr:30S ribosomal protein S6e [Candidatus Bathyarchaeota archaeon]